jgi:hypothetical protein
MGGDAMDAGRFSPLAAVEKKGAMDKSWRRLLQGARPAPKQRGEGAMYRERRQRKEEDSVGRRRLLVAAGKMIGVGVENVQVSTPIYRSSPRVRVL